MNERTNSCKGCDEQYSLTGEQINRILEKPSMQTGDHLVDMMVYEARLSQCRSCDQLWQGETCLLCGCFVRVSAKLKQKSCPDQKNKRWDTLTST